VPHEVYNIGEEPLVAFVARSAADEWDRIVAACVNGRTAVDLPSSAA